MTYSAAAGERGPAGEEGAMDTGEKSEVKHIGKPEEVREFPRGKVELVTLGGPQWGGPRSCPAGGGPPA